MRRNTRRYTQAHDRLAKLEEKAEPDFFDVDGVSLETLREFCLKVGQLAPEQTLAEAGLSDECWADLLANLTPAGRKFCDEARHG